MEKIITSTSPEQTQDVAFLIGKQLKGGEIIELVSDLGGGKTTFVRGMAKGAGSNEKVASPSFTISKVYKAGRLTIYHFDFYRLSDPGVVEYELLDVAGAPDTVTVIEWPIIIEHDLPADRLIAEFKLGASENMRQLIFNYPKSLSYLLAIDADTND